jgi:hypothetical protein
MATIDTAIKFTLPGDQVAAGLAALGLHAADADTAKVYFLDRLDPGGDPWLFGNGVILRVRREPDDAGEVTATLCPVEQARLTGRWRPGTGHEGADYVVAYERPGLSASVIVRHETGVEALLDGPRKQVFSAAQQDFLRRCGPSLEQPMRDLSFAGPVAVRRWPTGELSVEQWTWGAGNTVLELSRPHAAGDLSAELERLGLKPDDSPTTTTETVLRDLL